MIHLIQSTERAAPRSNSSILGDVRRITPKAGAGGREVVEIEHTDGTKTILVFEAAS